MKLRHLVVLLIVAGCASANEHVVPDAAPTPIDATAIDACVPKPEICNHADDDCDGTIDEDVAMLGDPCMVGTGACQAAGHYVCDDQGGVVCDATTGTPVGELCNGIDDDCDGSIDEGLNVGQPCDGPDTDLCLEGVIQCDGSGNAICTDNTGDTVEQCNGVDDDCNGVIDDLWPIGQPCSAGVGACATQGTYQCTSLSSAACNAVAGTPTPELCGDGIDQDCNGSDVSCPTNDFPSGAIDISGGGTFSVDLSAAHDDNLGNCGTNGGRDVFYTFTLGAAQVVYFDTFGSNFDSVLRVYPGACTALGAQVTCFDDACSTLQTQGAVSLGAGQYCLVADQYSSSQTNGALVLRVTMGGRTGTLISSASGSHTQTGNTTGAASAQDSTMCRATTQAPDNSYFFTVCPTSITVNANTCGSGFDTVLTLRSGNTETACNDDSTCSGTAGLQSTLPATTITGPGLFWLVVDGYNTSSGAYTLSYSM